MNVGVSESSDGARVHPSAANSNLGFSCFADMRVHNCKSPSEADSNSEAECFPFVRYSRLLNQVGPERRFGFKLVKAPDNHYDRASRWDRGCRSDFLFVYAAGASFFRTRCDIPAQSPSPISLLVGKDFEVAGRRISPEERLHSVHFNPGKRVTVVFCCRLPVHLSFSSGGIFPPSLQDEAGCPQLDHHNPTFIINYETSRFWTADNTGS